MGPVRMISSGHELTTDYDEKTLHELGFKDMQVTHHNGLQKQILPIPGDSMLRHVCVSVRRWCSSLWERHGGRGRERASSCRPPVCLPLRRSTSPCCCSSRSHTSPRCSTCWRCWPVSNLPVQTQRSSRRAQRCCSCHSPLHLLNLGLF